MKLVLFHPAFEAVGGAELLIAEHALCLREAGHDVRLLTFAFDPDRWRSRLPGIAVDVVEKFEKLPWTERISSWRRSHSEKLLQQADRAAPFLARGDRAVAYNYPSSALLGSSGISVPKLWQCNEPPRRLYLRPANPTLAARVANGAAPPASLAAREFKEMLLGDDRGEARKRDIRQRRLFDVRACSELSLIYAISEFSRDNAREIYGRCDEKVVYPIVRFARAGRTRAGLDRSGLRVLVHSRLEVMKNVDTVLRGFRLFQQARGSAARLHVVGEGVARRQLEKLATRIGLRYGVYFHGFLPDEELARVYEACDVFALLPLDEPFGMVFPEAAAKGLLLIGPNHGGPLEILDDGRLGWTVDALSPEALAAALDEVWQLTDAEVDQRRQRALAACVDRYSREAIWPRLREHLEREL